MGSHTHDRVSVVMDWLDLVMETRFDAYANIDKVFRYACLRNRSMILVQVKNGDVRQRYWFSATRGVRGYFSWHYSCINVHMCLSVLLRITSPKKSRGKGGSRGLREKDQ